MFCSRTGHLGCGSISAGIAKILSKAGALDVWVNSAYPKSKDWGLAFEKVSIDSWRTAVDSQMTSYCLCCREAAEAMRSRKRGSIINLGSTYGMVGPDFSIYEGTALTMPAAYAAIKGGIINFTRYLASYYAKDGIRFNCISPGGVENNQDSIMLIEQIRSQNTARKDGQAERYCGRSGILGFGCFRLCDRPQSSGGRWLDGDLIAEDLGVESNQHQQPTDGPLLRGFFTVRKTPSCSEWPQRRPDCRSSYRFDFLSNPNP